MSNLIVSGLNHHTSPISIREQFSIPKSCVSHALDSLRQSPSIQEAILLSTCNRTEVYALTSNIQTGFSDLNNFFSMVQSVSGHDVLEPEFRLLREDVVLHLLRVASGLDSIVLGESQIMAQIKEAHQTALVAKVCGRNLDYIFKLALECGKQVRTCTNLSKGSVSVSSVAIDMAKERLSSLNNRTILIVGAGTMARSCLKILSSNITNSTIYIINRNIDAANKLAKGFKNQENNNIYSASLEELYNLAGEADLIIVATGSTSYLIDHDKFVDKGKLSNRRQVLIDISVPRNIDPRLSNLESIDLLSVDDLVSIVERNLSNREELINQVENIIAEYLDEYTNWQLTNSIIPTITKLKLKLEEKRINEVKKVKCPVVNEITDENYNLNDQVTKSLINTILHEPISHLKSITSKDSLLKETTVLSRLFSLDSHNK